MQTEQAKALGMRVVYSQTSSSNERLVLENPQAVRHRNSPKDKLVCALRKCAEARGCTPRELLVTRLAEMQRRIICALGQVSFEQFHNPGPVGYVTMRLSETGFNVSVEFRPVFLLGAIYHEALITPGSLQQRKAQLLAPILERAAQQGVSMSKDQAENQLLEQLKNGESHWDGRKKADLSMEVLAAEGIASKALSFVERDHDLDLQAFAESPLRLQQLTQQQLDRLGLQDMDQP